MFGTVSGGDIVLEMHAHIAESCLETEWIANLVIRKAVYGVVPGVLVGKKDALVIKTQCCNTDFYSKAVGWLSCQLRNWNMCSLFCMGLGKKYKSPYFLFCDGSGKNPPLFSIKFLLIVFKLFLNSVRTSPSEQVVEFWKPSERRVSHTANFWSFLSPYHGLTPASY